MATTEKVVLSAQVPVHVRDELDRRAKEADRTLSAEVRRALNGYLMDEHLRDVKDRSARFHPIEGGTP
jgi:hypothetical protein